jgi:hypothetical protein
VQHILDTHVQPYVTEHGCLLVWSRNDTLDLYDALTEVSVPLTRRTTRYDMRIQAVEGNQLTLAVYPLGPDAVDGTRLMRFVLRVPQLCRYILFAAISNTTAYSEEICTHGEPREPEIAVIERYMSPGLVSGTGLLHA